MRVTLKRNTLQRQIIIDTIKALDIHPSAEEIYAEIQKNHPIVGKSTLYRNLRQLAEEGLIVQINMEGFAIYDKNTHLHYHFICENCGKVIDVEIDHTDSLHGTIYEKYGLRATRHEVKIFGLCPRCAV